MREPVFRSLWLAMLAGNIGTWMHDVAATWLMAEMTGSPLMVAAVQSAMPLRMVFLAVWAGVLADIASVLDSRPAVHVFGRDDAGGVCPPRHGDAARGA
jgi:hypothetical protein